jgi:UDP-N-acetylmuramoyl-tripeptide--D-alanyl-D-alanine ligase
MNTTYLPFLFLFFIILLYKTFFWLYVIQLKEYRIDRFREYAWTIQWKSAFLNVWSVVEGVLLVSCFALIFSPLIERILGNMIFVFLLLEFVFIFWKWLRKRILYPKFTSRLLITLLSLFFIYASVFAILFLVQNVFIFYWLLLFSLIAVPVYIFIAIFLTLPIVNKVKAQKIQKAKDKVQSLDGICRIWITWSFGKSSVKTYLQTVLSSKFSSLSTPENINSELWVSSVILEKLNKNYAYFVAEMWAYRKWEIELLWSIVDHKYWFLTWIWNQHLGLFWSIDNTKEGKFEIYNSVKKNNGKLFLNLDNLHIEEHLEKEKIDGKYIISYALNNKDADVWWQILNIENAITNFQVFIREKRLNFSTHLLWSHNILNLCWVIAYCDHIWMSEEEIQIWFDMITTPKNTLELHNKSNTICIDDSYNLSEDWLLAWLDAASSFGKEKRIYLILDDILELWQEAEKRHKFLAKQIAENFKLQAIHFCWKNYKSSIIEWLKEIWKEDLLKNKFEFETSEDIVYLFEWRSSSRLLKKILQSNDN